MAVQTTVPVKQAKPADPATVPAKTEKVEPQVQVPPAPPKRPPISAFVVQKDFRMTIDSAILSFTAGQVLYDASLAKRLIDKGAPITPVDENTMVLRCPHCGRFYTTDKGR